MKNRFFTARMKMSDVIGINHTLILVMPRFGVPLGFGERSILEICDKYGLPVDFVLLVFNVYTFDEYLPDEATFDSTDLSLLVPYLKASHRYYINERLPHIERHLMSIASGAGDRYGEVLKKFFADYKREVTDHFACEENVVFPYMQSLEKEICMASQQHTGIKRTNRENTLQEQLSSHFEDGHTDLVDKLSDLEQILYKYIPGEHIAEELSELVFAVLQLSSDLQKHALIEEKIMLPYIEQMERRLS